MDSTDDEIDTSDPAVAFDAMREELALLRSAVRGLAAEKERIPDYSETLGQIVQRVAHIDRGLGALAKSPLLQLTPEAVAARIAAAANDARKADAETIARVRKGFEHGIAEMGRRVQSARTADQQNRFVLIVTGAAAAITILLWSIVPGMVVRAMPARWHMPERVARHIVGETTMWKAGIRIMSADSPSSWAAIAQAMKLRLDNRDAIDACEERAGKEKRAVRCTVMIGDEADTAGQSTSTR